MLGKYALYLWDGEGNWCLAGRNHSLWSALKYSAKGYKVVKDKGVDVEMETYLPKEVF